eukprot:COSAG06_NODE_35271_length_462_cov_0.754821_2_plen_43_part_01
MLCEQALGGLSRMRASMQELEAFRPPLARFREGTAGAWAGYYG